MAWVNNYDTSYPDGAVVPVSALDDSDRTIKKAIQERLDGNDIYFPLTGTQVSSIDAGKHRKVTFKGLLAVKPTLATDECALYTKMVSGKWELFFENEDGTEKQLTTLGAINVAEAEILGLLTNNTYFTAINTAGTGTTNLIKAGQNEAADTDVAVLSDKTRLETNAAPLEDTALANKKYVDDEITSNATMVPAVTGSGTGYAGEESITFQNGLIMKMGISTGGTGGEAIVFDEAFPNVILNIQCTLIRTGTQVTDEEILVTPYSVTGFTFNIMSNNSSNVFWQAWGC